MKQIILFLFFITSSINFIKCQIPNQLAFFSNDVTSNELFQFNRINLNDGSINATYQTSKNIPKGKLLGVTGYDGQDWYDFTSFNGKYYYDGTFSSQKLGDDVKLYGDLPGSESEYTNFSPHPISVDTYNGHHFYIGWLLKTNVMAIFNMMYPHNEPMFFYNSTKGGDVVNEKYQSSLTQCYSNNQQEQIMYINWIDPQNNRILIAQEVYGYNANVNLYSYKNDLTSSVNSRVYLIYSSASTDYGLLMVEVDDINKNIKLIGLLTEVDPSGGSYVTMKLIHEFDNNGGSNDDGLPFCQNASNEPYLLILSKSSSTQYTITTIDLLHNFKIVSTTTSNYNLKFNNALYYN